MEFVIKWINKLSKEEGYVGGIRKVKGYFINSWELEGAKKYRSISMAEKDLAILCEIGEDEKNWFVIKGCRAA